MPMRNRVTAVTGVVFAATALVLTGCGGGSSKPTPPAASTVPSTATTAPAPVAPTTSAQAGVADLSNDAGCNEAMNALLSAGKLPKDDPLKAATGLAAILDKLGDAAVKTKRPGAADAINNVIGDIRATIKDGGQNKAADQAKLKDDTTNLANVCFG